MGLDKAVIFRVILFMFVIPAVIAVGRQYQQIDADLFENGEVFDLPKKEMIGRFMSQHLPLDPVMGKICIPKNIKHIKLDIGLSYSAPMSQYWLSHEDDLMVFGFEPNPAAILAIKNGAVKVDPTHGDPLDLKYVGRSFFLVPCALGLSDHENVKFYITKEDCGCSSLYEPCLFDVESIIDVPIFSLSDFFEFFPFDIHPVIDYIKIDAQGSDLNIVKSAGDYLKDRVIFITIEADNQHYKNTNNSEWDIDIYMEMMGFVRYRSECVQDPTYVNMRFLDYLQKNEIKIYQRG